MHWRHAINHFHIHFVEHYDLGGVPNHDNPTDFVKLNDDDHGRADYDVVFVHHDDCVSDHDDGTPCIVYVDDDHVAFH